MAKLTLTNLNNLSDQPSAVAAINSNSTAIVTAMEKTLSRDGTAPNTMEADFDMNSNRILNLPEPTSDTEPARHGDIAGYVDDASTSATAAASSASSASTSATSASTSASSASTSATNAAASATSAAASAALAEGILTGGFSDGTFKVYDNVDNTKEVKLQVSGVTTGTTRTLTVPNSNGTILIDGNIGSTVQAYSSTLANTTASFTTADETKLDFITITQPVDLDAVEARNSFSTVAVSGQSDVVADQAADTLTLVAGTNVTLTTNATNDSVTINASIGGSGISDGDYGDIVVSSGGTVLSIDSGVLTSAGRALIDDADAAAQRTTLGLGSGDSPQFTAVNVGHATDTSITRVSAGRVAVEGSNLLRESDAASNNDTITGTDTAKYVTPSSLSSLLLLQTGSNILNGSLSWSVSSNALTIALKTDAGTDPSTTDPVWVRFRSSTASSGVCVWRKVTSSLSVTVSSGSTLGCLATTPFKLWSVLFDNAGTVVLGVINCVNRATGTPNNKHIFPLRETQIVSSTAEGGAGAADSNHTFYTTSAVTSKAYVIAGNATWNSGLTTIGTWDVGPDVVQAMLPGIPLPGLPTGNRQYKAGFSEFSTTSTSYVDTGITLSITPTNAANFINVVTYANTQSPNSAHLTAQLLRGSTSLEVRDLYDSGDSTAEGQIFWHMTDQPGSTSSQTYKIQAKAGSANSVYLPRTADGQTGGVMTLEEIAV